MEKISEAVCFATAALDGVLRKCDGSLAILHSLEVAAIAGTLTSDIDVIIAAVLHDTVEDGGVTLCEIERKFGKRVASLVGSETENKRRNLPAASTWRVRKEESISILNASDDMGVKLLFLADKLSNIRSLYRLTLKFGDGLWDMFNQKDKRMQEWYYRELARGLEVLSDTPAYKEYIALVNQVFSEEDPAFKSEEIN